MDSIKEGKAEDMEGFMRILAKAAEEKLTLTTEDKKERLPSRTRATSRL